MSVPLEKYKPISTPSISERDILDPPLTFRKSWVPAVWQVQQERRNRRELWFVVVAFSIAAILSLFWEEAGAVVVPVALVVVTMVLGYAAFGRGKHVAVVPRDDASRE